MRMGMGMMRMWMMVGMMGMMGMRWGVVQQPERVESGRVGVNGCTHAALRPWSRGKSAGKIACVR